MTFTAHLLLLTEDGGESINTPKGAPSPVLLTRRFTWESISVNQCIAVCVKSPPKRPMAAGWSESHAVSFAMTNEWNHSERYSMKNGQNLRDLQQQKAKKVDELWVHQPVCMVCKKPTEGYYARYGESGVCGSACMRIQAKVYSYGEHTEESFLKNIGEA